MSRTVCKLCGKTNYGQGLCRTHHRQAVKAGTIVVTPKGARPMCTIDGCDKPNHCRGFCRTHYRRNEGAGEFKPRGTCSFPGCDRLHAAKGLCKAHHKQQMTKGVLTPIAATRSCSVKGCHQKHKAKGYCEPHYKRQHAGLDLEAPIPRRKPAASKAADRSKLPVRWEKVTPEKTYPKPSGTTMPPLVVMSQIPAAQRLATRQLLARRGALDLADMLGVTP